MYCGIQLNMTMKVNTLQQYLLASLNSIHSSTGVQ